MNSDDMQERLDKYDSAPLEYMHSELMNLFHEARRMTVGQNITSMPMDGSFLNRMIAEAKSMTYKKYQSLRLYQEPLKSELGK